MKKLTYLLLIILVSMVTLSSASFAIILTNSNYLTTALNWLSKQYISPELSITNATYIYPRELQLKQVTFDDKQNSNISIWFNNQLPESFRNLSVDTILISNLDISQKTHLYQSIKSLHPNLISFKNINYHEDGLILKDANIQITQPDWQDNALLPYGQIQLQSDQLQIEGLTVNNVLLDADYYEDESKIYGLSFKINDASAAIQAHTDNNSDWVITSLTANRLDLSAQLFKQLKSINNTARQHVSYIERLDLLNSSFKNPLLEISNLSLSAKNISPYKGNIWSQNGLTLSASAEGLTYAGKQWVEPALTAEIDDEKIHIDELSAKLADGYLNASASLTPALLNIEHLRAEKIKYYFESDRDFFTDLKLPFSNISIENLQIRNSQILQIATQPYWQLSGITMDLNKAVLLREGKLRLWSGSLELSANNASYGDLKGTQAIMKMHSQNDTWYLDRLFSPLQKGYIELKGAWNFARNNGHWFVNVNADSFPVQTIMQYWNLPVTISGLADISLNSKGLTGNTNIFRQTISGKANINLRDGTLKIPEQQPIVSHPFTLNNLNITSQRGLVRISQTNLTSPSMTSTLSGNVDLDDWEKGAVQLTVQQNSCSDIKLNLLQKSNSKIKCHQPD